MNWEKYFDKANWHQLANLFPVMTEEEIADLASDITKNGLEDPIVLFEDKVLDGRNRLLAMELANLPLREECFVHFRNIKDPKCSWGDCADSPLAWIVSKNLHRRHLTTSQRATVAVDMEPFFAAEIAKREHERKTGTVANLPESSERAREKAAVAMQVSPRSVQDAKKLKKEDPKAFEQVKAGEKTLNAAKQPKSSKSISSTAASVAAVETQSKPASVADLTETFYVIRRKSDGWFHQCNCDKNHQKKNHMWVEQFLVSDGKAATSYRKIFELNDEYADGEFVGCGWVKVQATYQLTAVPQDSKKEEAA